MGSLGPEVLSPKDKNRILFDSLPATLPTGLLPDDVDHAAVAASGVALLNNLKFEDLHYNTVWRDLCAFTGTFRSFYDAQKVICVWEKQTQLHRPYNFQAVTGSSEIIRVSNKSSWVQTAYTFQTQGTPETQCSGILGLVPDPGTSKWKIWMVTTLLEELKGYPSPDRMNDLSSFTNGASGSSSEYTTNGTEHPKRFQCVVAGAGFSGLVVAGRLKRMGINVITLDKNPRLGDNWRDRYDSARFHTTKAYCDFPLARTFTPEDPIFPGRLDLARSYDRYVSQHALDIWCSSELDKATYDTDKKLWTLQIRQPGKTATVKTNHIVLAIGGLGAVPNMPNLPGKEVYKGEVLHSFDYKSAYKWTGKTGVVVGSANTAHDVAEDMVDAKLSSVTLIQRTATPVFPIEWYKNWMDKYYYEGSDMEAADRKTISLPIPIARHISMNYYQSCMMQDPKKLDELEQAGYRVERSGDMVKCAFGDGAGGHHTDVGGGAKIIAGQIKVVQGEVCAFTETGVELTNGKRVDAEALVFCTGFHTNMTVEATKIVGPTIGKNLEHFWGINAEGELRGAFKQMKQPGIYFAGGGAPWARFGSRFIALQIQADLVGKPLQQYTDL